MKYILDDNDNVIPCEDTMKWGKWFEENRIRRILCRTHVTPDVYVSTVFLCLDHGLGHPLQSKPILWETMVVGLKGDIAEEYEGYERYDSREDAIKGHLGMVDKVKEDIKKQAKDIHPVTLHGKSGDFNLYSDQHGIKVLNSNLGMMFELPHYAARDLWPLFKLYADERKGQE